MRSSPALDRPARGISGQMTRFRKFHFDSVAATSKRDGKHLRRFERATTTSTVNWRSSSCLKLGWVPVLIDTDQCRSLRRRGVNCFKHQWRRPPSVIIGSLGPLLCPPQRYEHERLAAFAAYHGALWMLHAIPVNEPKQRPQQEQMK